MAHVRPQVYTLHLRRQVWLETEAMLRANPDLPDSYWWGFMTDTYVVTQAVAVRAQVDKRDDVICLARVLREMSKNPGANHAGLLLQQRSP
jgi:hypothetical protein